MLFRSIVEVATRDQLYKDPLHPYTKALLSAVPEADPSVESTVDRVILKGDVPSPSNPPQGCNFSTRCPVVMAVCKTEDPATREVVPGRHVACHLYDATKLPAGQKPAAPEVHEHQQGE